MIGEDGKRSFYPSQVMSPVGEGFHDGQQFSFVDVVVSFGRRERCRVECDGMQFWFLGGDCVVFTLLREYGAHAIGRCVGLEEEGFVEVRLREYWAGAHSRFEFFERLMLRVSPMPNDSLLCKVQ